MMQLHDMLDIAGEAISGNPDRPATAVVHDCADARVIVFRIEPGQAVPMHSSTSTVMLTVLRGDGIISGPADGPIVDRSVGAGTIVTYSPGELHGMRATGDSFVVVATISPKPGARRTDSSIR